MITIVMLLSCARVFAGEPRDTGWSAMPSYLNYKELGEKPLVKCYPNPATTVIYFNIDKNSKTSGASKILIFNFTGRKLSELSVDNNSEKVTLDLEKYTRGLYLFQLVKYDGAVIETGKFQVLK